MIDPFVPRPAEGAGDGMADSMSGVGNGTFASSIILLGVITGSYTHASGPSHGFVRMPGG